MLQIHIDDNYKNVALIMLIVHDSTACDKKDCKIGYNNIFEIIFYIYTIKLFLIIV